MDTKRIKVLTYKADGNTPMEKWFNANILAPGVYSIEDKDLMRWVYEFDGVYIMCGNPMSRYRHRTLTKDDISKALEHKDVYIESLMVPGRFIRKIDIILYQKLGMDYAELERNREAFVKRREDDRKRDLEAREKAKKEAEQQHLKDTVSKFLSGGRLCGEDFLLLCKMSGVYVHPRTAGMILHNDVAVSSKPLVWGPKKIDYRKTFDAILSLKESLSLKQ